MKAEWQRMNNGSYLPVGMGFDITCKRKSGIRWSWKVGDCFGNANNREFDGGDAPTRDEAEAAGAACWDQMLADLAAARGYKLVKEDTK